MTANWLLFIAILLNFTQDACGNHSFANIDEYFHYHNSALHKRIFTGYRKEVSPYSEKGRHDIPIDVSLSYARLVSLDQVEEVVHLIVFFRVIWHDGRLEWSPSLNGNINHIYMSMDNVWMPQITVLNDMFGKDFFGQSKRPNVLINHTGFVHFYSHRIADIVCPLDVRLNFSFSSTEVLLPNEHFPFDGQICSLILVRRRCYEVNEPHIVSGKSESIDVHNLEAMGNGEWEVQSIRPFQFTGNDSYGPIDFVIFDFGLKRKPEFYIVMVILPTFIMTTLTIFGIFGRHTSIEHEFITELSLGITSLTTIALMLDIVAEHMPKTDVFPLIAKFLICHITLMATSILTVILHPRFLYPKYRRIRSALLKSMESEVMPASIHRDRILRLLRQSLKKYRPANVVFMIFFQTINVGSCVYVLSHWK